MTASRTRCSAPCYSEHTVKVALHVGVETTTMRAVCTRLPALLAAGQQSLSLEIALQYAAEIAVIDCIIKENQVWQQRLEERVQEQHGKVTCHKPQTWQQMQDMLLR